MSDLTLCQQIQVKQLMATREVTVKNYEEILNSEGIEMCHPESVDIMYNCEYAVIAAQVIANTPRL